jgi:hypothetical protein
MHGACSPYSPEIGRIGGQGGHEGDPSVCPLRPCGTPPPYSPNSENMGEGRVGAGLFQVGGADCCQRIRGPD